MTADKSIVIDIHTHLMDGGLYTDDANDNPVEHALQEMDEAGVDLSVLLGIGFDAEGLADNNRQIREAVDAHPDRFVGFLGVDPHEDPGITCDQIDRAVQEWGFRGLKMHQWLQMFPTNDPIVYPIMERASHYEIPVVFHSGTPPYTTPVLIADLAKRYPRVPVIIGHMGKTTLYYDCLTVMREVDNLYCDFSGNPLVGVLEWGIQNLGAHKFLYGSDEFGAGPGQAYGLEQIRHMMISENQKRQIIGGNAAKLLKLTPGKKEGGE
ncbi:amidohydrolase family protein [Paenibacillus daejeonensis]|uniref:amidohydrolase family protein n=1 Tax=Paenibacillus daejeonensis TaxID=135193 RepID=UPI00036840E0|nr:amidohydrolase family protein [Paenibacillus daejeonensis]